MLQNEQEGQKAFQLHERVKQNEIHRRRLLFDSMEAIHELHKGKHYQTILGDENAPWSAYLGQHDTYYSASQIYTYDKIYQKFRNELGVHPDTISEIPVTKLSNLITVVNLDNVNDWLTKAKELTTQDFNDELRKAHGKISYLDCPHKFVPYSICGSCGFRHKGEHHEETTV